MNKKARVALLGLGTMGIGMAGRLLEAGFDLAVFNRTAEKAQPLGAKGARVSATPREAATGAELILSVVADDAASRAMWLGGNGALAGAPRGAVLVESSTLSTAWLSELAQAALKFISAVLRERRQVSIRDSTVDYLLGRLKNDLTELDRQGLTFNFLRAIMARKIQTAKVYEILDYTGEIMITNQSRGTRDPGSAALSFHRTRPARPTDRPLPGGETDAARDGDGMDPGVDARG